MKEIRLHLLIILVVVMLGSCSSKTATTQGKEVVFSGFLDDYSILREGGKGEPLFVYKNPKVDENLHKALVTLNRKEREELYKEAGRQVVEDAAAIFVNNENWFAPINKGIGGIRFCPIGNGNELRWVHWKT